MTRTSVRAINKVRVRASPHRERQPTGVLGCVPVAQCTRKPCRRRPARREAEGPVHLDRRRPHLMEHRRREDPRERRLLRDVRRAVVSRRAPAPSRSAPRGNRRSPKCRTTARSSAVIVQPTPTGQLRVVEVEPGNAFAAGSFTFATRRCSSQHRRVEDECGNALRPVRRAPRRTDRCARGPPWQESRNRARSPRLAGHTGSCDDHDAAGSRCHVLPKRCTL